MAWHRGIERVPVPSCGLHEQSTCQPPWVCPEFVESIREDEMANVWNVVQPMSATDMYNCTHGPKKDCAQCLVGELVAALEGIWELADYLPKDANVGGATFELLDEIQAKARAVLEKAKEAQG